MSEDLDDLFDDDEDDLDLDDVEPLPKEFRYVDRAARKVVRKEWIGHPPWKVPPLPRSHLKLLATLCERLYDEGQSEELDDWMHTRMAQEAGSKGKLKPIGGRIYGLLMLTVVLADAGVEPFASKRVTECTNSKRSEYTSPPARCEATEIDPAECVIPTGDSDQSGDHYLLSHAAADRLENRCLSPIEWYRLVVRHGRRPYHLWDDFYGNDGSPFQDMFPVKRSPGDHVPRLGDVRHSLGRLLDYAFFNLQLDGQFRVDTPAALAALAAFGRPAIEAELDARFRRQPIDRVDALCWKVRVKLGYVDEKRLNERWARADSGAGLWKPNIPDLARDSVPVLGSAATIDRILEASDRLARRPAGPDGRSWVGPAVIAMTLRDCMDADMLLELVFVLLDRVPVEKRADQLFALTEFRDNRALDWIERNAREPIDYQWGTAAAMNRMSWETVKRWLDRGRPLSLVALDAMKNCRGFDEDDPQMSGVFRDHTPEISGKPKEAEVRAVLSAYARRDPARRVTDAVAIILANVAKIF